MQLKGSAAPCAAALLTEAAEAVHVGRPVFLWCDGEDVTLLVAEEGESVADVQRLAHRVMPEVAA